MDKDQYNQWMRDFSDNVREACKAFKRQEDWPKAWLLLDNDEEHCWYDREELLGFPVYRSNATLTHSGHDGEGQAVIPLWIGDVSHDKYRMMRREFEARLARSGDF